MLNSARKSPRQARSRATVDVILDATVLVLAAEGYAAATTTRIADRAGVSVGSLYQYFPNREALVNAVAHRHDMALQREVGLSLAAVRGASLRTVLGRGLRTVIQAHGRNLALQRVLVEEAPRLGARSWVIDPDAYRHTTSRQVFDQHESELRAGFNREAAAFLIPNVVGASIAAATLSRPAAFDSGELETELTEMIYSYVAGR